VAWLETGSQYEVWYEECSLTLGNLSGGSEYDLEKRNTKSAADRYHLVGVRFGLRVPKAADGCANDTRAGPEKRLWQAGVDLRNDLFGEP
jgi:hypothetical protein